MEKSYGHACTMGLLKLILLTLLIYVRFTSAGSCSFVFDTMQCIGNVEDEIQTLNDTNNLKLVVLAMNNITTLNANRLEKFVSVENINLTYSKISHVDEDTFKNMTNLKSVNLMCNEIINLPEDVFFNNHQIVELDFFSNRLSKINKNLFSKLLLLETIDFSWNQIQNLSSHLFRNNINLKKIFLRKNNITTIPGHIFKDLSLLSKVDLSYNRIEDISGHIFKYNYRLEEVLLRENHIKYLDYSVTHLNLKTYDVLGNPLDMHHESVKETLNTLHRGGVITYVSTKHHKSNKERQHHEDTSVERDTKIILVVTLISLIVLVVVLSTIAYAYFRKYKNSMQQQLLVNRSRDRLVIDDYSELETTHGEAYSNEVYNPAIRADGTEDLQPSILVNDNREVVGGVHK